MILERGAVEQNTTRTIRFAVNFGILRVHF